MGLDQMVYRLKFSGKIKEYDKPEFFFGNYNYDEHMKVEFVENALINIDEGYSDYYYSSW